MSDSAMRVSRLQTIPRGVWALGFVSLFMDVSSEMVHSLLPVFFVSVIGMSYTAVGVVEGLAQAIALVTKVFSGVLSDHLGKRKPLALAGYGLAALTKPVFALASTAGWVVSARFVDRIGKGIRGAPRDALIADITPETARGASYGLRQSLDSAGAFIGPLLALGLMILLAGDIRGVFWFAVAPAVCAVLILWFGVHEPIRQRETGVNKPALKLSSIKQLRKPYWITVGIGAVMMLAGFSEAFLVLRAQQLGLQLSLIPLVFIVMNIVYTLSAYPAGVLSDRLGRPGLIVAGFIALIAADILLGIASDVWIAMAGIVLWGLYMGLTQGALMAMVADTAPAAMRGTAFGVFNMVSGIALLSASAIAGILWDLVGPHAPFFASAGLATLALILWGLRTRSLA
ncbi:MAG: MFS transporter [Gammaproteobacteria bacterium]|jgi:MFS family permease